jgi:hypothetical protein
MAMSSSLLPEAAESDRASIEQAEQMTPYTSGPPEAYYSTSDYRSVNEFDYKPVPVLAPVTLVVGLLASVSLLTELALPLALFGLITGTICLRQIRKSDGEFGGKWVTRSGVLLSGLFLVSGTGLHTHAYATEVPEGYLRVNFPREISKRGFEVKDGRLALHPEVANFVDKKVFLKGYIWQTRVTEGLDSFILLKDNGECCFGGEAAPNDMMLVRMLDGQRVKLYTGLVSVGGTLRFDPDARPGEPVYTLEATHYSRARTMY